MKKEKLRINFGAIKNKVLSEYTHGIVLQTSTSTFIPNGIALSLPLDKAVKLLDTALASTTNPTKAQTAERDNLRLGVKSELSRLAIQLNLDYEGQTAVLLSSGLPLVSNGGAAGRPAGELPAPTNVRLLDGHQPGCLLLKFKRPVGAIQTVIRYTTDLSLPEENWQMAVGGGRERELGSFPPGTRVYVKVAAINGSTMEPVYSAVFSRLVQ